MNYEILMPSFISNACNLTSQPIPLTLDDIGSMSYCTTDALVEIWLKELEVQMHPSKIISAKKGFLLVIPR